MDEGVEKFVPQQLCQDSCQFRFDACAETKAVQEAQGISLAQDRDCAAEKWGGNYGARYAEQVDQPSFGDWVVNGVNIPCLEWDFNEVAGTAVEYADCGSPLFVLVDKDSSGASTCELKCPFPVYEESEMSALYILNLALLFVSLPLFALCIVVMVKNPTVYDRLTKHVILNSFIGCLMELFPSLIFYTDLVCDHEYSQVSDSDLNRTFVKGNSVGCAFQRFSKFVLQSVLLLLAAQMFSLYYKTSRRETFPWIKGLHIACYVIPFSLSLVAFGLDDDANFGQVREIFSCIPRLASVELEFCVVWLPLLIGASIIALSSGLVFKYYASVSRGANSKSVDTGKLKKLLLGPGGKLMGISTANTVLAIINAVTAILILPNLDAFNEEAKDWQRCEIYESSCNSFLANPDLFAQEVMDQYACDEADLNCVNPSSRPAVGIMGLFYVCTPLSFFFVALVYTTNARFDLDTDLDIDQTMPPQRCMYVCA
jgi:hypothetical protein